jgi:hypothetical protein
MKEREKKHKIIARVSERDYKRLERIVKIYGFRSVYALQNYLTYCFLRVVDREHDTSTADLPEEIIRLFPVREDAEAVYAAARKVRKRKSIGIHEPDMFATDADGKTIEGMFDDAMDSGRSREFEDNIRKRNER